MILAFISMLLRVSESTVTGPISISTETKCARTENMFWDLDGLWLPYNLTSDNRVTYSMYTDHSAQLYLYWSSIPSVWIIGTEFGETEVTFDHSWYICYQQNLTNCANGEWQYWNYWEHDDDAAVYLDECPVNMTTTTPSPTTDGCTPSIETLNFYDPEMDGKWIKFLTEDYNASCLKPKLDDYDIDYYR